MMSETFTNWLTRPRNLTHFGRTHTCSINIIFFIIMIMIKINLSDDEKGRKGDPRAAVALVHGSGQRVREMSGGEDEGGAQGRI